MAHLILMLPTGESLFTLGEMTYLGRAPECDVLLSDASVSRRHARIVKEHGNYVLHDEGSRFGCFINGKEAVAQALREGDQIALGSVEMRFSLDDESGAAIALRSDSNTPHESGLELESPAELKAELKRTRTLLAFQHAVIRCTSLPMVMQASGPEFLKALRAEKLMVLAYDAPNNGFQIHFQHGIAQIPAHRVPAVDEAFGSGQLRPIPPDAEGRMGLVAPIEGGERFPQGLVYAEFPPGRTPTELEIALARDLCSELASALTHHRLILQIREEAAARANLSRYLPDQVVEAVLAGSLNLALGGELRTVTVLFTDIRSFTTLSEHMPPEHVLAMLNAYFSEAVPIIKRYDGTVDKFIGDALMAVFGAPAAQTDQAERAVKAAMEIRSLVARLRDSWSQAPFAAFMDVQRFAVGVGVNTGPAVAGNLGSEDRREFGVIGDAVNVAARLCSKAAADEILIGGDTAAAVREMISLRALEPMMVKGRAQPVSAFTVL